MNSRKKLISAGLAVLLLAGCKDATAKLANSGETLMTIGNTTLTKGELYNMMFASVGASTADTNVMNAIAEQEIEVTDEMREEAMNQVSFYSMMYGSQFTSFLESMDMTEEEYAEKYFLADQRKQKLTEKYIDENFETLCGTYDPLKAIVLSFTSEDDASAALSALKDGSVTPAEAAADNNSSSTGDEEVITINTTSYDTAALTVLRSMSVDDGWTEIPSTDGATFYVLKLVSHSPAEFREDAISALSENTVIATDSTEHYLRKYNFHVYDINLYNALKESNPDMLIQDKPASTPAPAAAPAETAEPAATAESN